ncbi:glycoside hydrolase family 3 protein [Adhaeretor mobilis]|uniref:beta-N-acetylhexosaminidase n=1 Tax=Adhaeretor mobilis TaxID=1930276 RepID=A0A517MTS9_9BACT|nr:glycoside hydrolase family 3 protein [Adhaeretor mobilis]QDS98288.1 putative lipoprotein YbbD precursor [Adhaeretor mobilis]
MTDAKLKKRPTELREKLAQLMFVRIGSNLSPVRTVGDDAARIENLLKECPVGGLILFNGRRGETAQTLDRLQSLSEIPLLVGSDIERGVGQQLLGHVVFPHAMAFEAMGDQAVQAVREFAEVTAKMALANGIHITFSPVADVNSEPRNPIIATRAYGTTPARAAELVSAFVESTQAAGLLSAAKHFPGHGDTQDDSHSDLPVVDKSAEELHACELVPFKAAIRQEVSLIMTAHVQYPQLDDSGRPATLSQPILTDLLRKEMGFAGAIISDSLLMEGVKQQSTDEGSLAIDALTAGVDILLDVADPKDTLDALVQAVGDGRLTTTRVEEAFEVVWQLKERIFAKPAIAAQGTPTDRGESQAEQLAADYASQAVTLVRNDKTLLPLNPDKSLLAVLLKPFTTSLDDPEQALAGALRTQFPSLSYFELGPESSQVDNETILQQAAAAEQVLVAMIVKPAAWHRFGLNERHQTLVQSLSEHQHCVLASLGTREALDPFSQAKVQICTFSDVPVSQRALVERIV